MNIITIKLVKNLSEASKKMYLIPDVKKGNKSEADVLFWFTALKEKGAILRMQSEGMAVTCFKYPKSYFEILSVFNEKILSKT